MAQIRYFPHKFVKIEHCNRFILFYNKFLTKLWYSFAMSLNISIDNLTIDEGIPGLKIGKLSATDASGAVTGTFSISNLPKYNGKDVPILEIKGNDLYLSEAWVANFENNYFESFAIGQVWAYPLSPKITFQDNTSVQTTEKVFTIQFNDLDESIDFTAFLDYATIPTQ